MPRAFWRTRIAGPVARHPRVHSAQRAPRFWRGAARYLTARRSHRYSIPQQYGRNEETRLAAPVYHPMLMLPVPDYSTAHFLRALFVGDVLAMYGISTAGRGGARGLVETGSIVDLIVVVGTIKEEE